ncbi:Phosphoserine phosphatase [methanotrophic endosymbiont of Bathymodiolus azoricus (Menez Gwen)]|nr:Phosphoserine phosphatase [methanotrophic endosymbiont of Bathymodiolus azoricus (Menez Gwen)]
MSLAIFDLDNTLLADDSDYLWGQFLVDQGIVDSSYYEQENNRFYKEYKEGNLDIYEFLKFSLKPLSDNPLQDLLKWRSQFIEEVIRPILLKPAQELINKHQQQGDILLVITATNKFVTEPIVELYGINHLLATTPEFLGERYTGNVAGTPCFQEGKITRLNEWLQVTGYSLDDSWFYSDSHNDLPLLQLVEHPVAVNPDEKLKQYAEKSNWPIISLRDK